MLRAYHTTSQTSTNETLFSLAFDIEAVILVKIGLPTMQIERFNELSNASKLRSNLDLLEKT